MSGTGLVERLHAALRPRAEQTAVKQLVLGLGYTAVLLEDGGVGIAYTWTDRVRVVRTSTGGATPKELRPRACSTCCSPAEGFRGASAWRRRTR